MLDKNRYIDYVESFPRFRLRYFVYAVVFFAGFIILAGSPEEESTQQDTQIVAAVTTDSKRDQLAKLTQEQAEQMSAISPASGPTDIPGLIDALSKSQESLKLASHTITPNLLKQAVTLSETELALPVAHITTPMKKPFFEIEEKITNISFWGKTKEKTLTVSSGDTLGSLLEKGGLSATEAHNITTALKHAYDPKDMQIGQQIKLIYKNDTFQGLSIQKDLLTSIELVKAEDDRYGVTQKKAATDDVFFAVGGDIESSLYKAALDQGMPDNVIVELIRVYSWAVDFQRDIRQGDKFETLYRLSKTKGGKIVPGTAEIVYAQLTLKDVAIPVYRYEDTNGDIGYYEEAGNSVRKALMKTPIDGARLSSSFGMRKHPVLGYNKMHKGVDFAAPRGTPIYAAGDGRISYLGTKGGYGKYIRIRHHSGLSTAYAHMSRYKKGLGNGARVKQGQIIGYVGTTGRSTGPHLHYEVLQGGRQVNPRKLKMQKGKKLAGKDLEIFNGVVEQTKFQFTELQQTRQVRNHRSSRL